MEKSAETKKPEKDFGKLNEPTGVRGTKVSNGGHTSGQNFAKNCGKKKKKLGPRKKKKKISEKKKSEKNEQAY